MEYTFGKYLKKLRNDRKLSHRDLCEISGINHSFISQIETGARKTTIQKVFILMNALKGLADNNKFEFVLSYIKDSAPQEIQHLFQYENFNEIQKVYLSLNSDNKEKLRKYALNLICEQQGT